MAEKIKGAEEIIADIFKEAAETEEISPPVLKKIKDVYDSEKFTRGTIKTALSEIKEN